MDFGYDNTYKPEPTIDHIELLDTTAGTEVNMDAIGAKINEIIRTVNALIPNKPRVYTKEESERIEKELYEMLFRSKYGTEK